MPRIQRPTHSIIGGTTASVAVSKALFHRNATRIVVLVKALYRIVKRNTTRATVIRLGFIAAHLKAIAVSIKELGRIAKNIDPIPERPGIIDNDILY
ncbi:hypothetical protein [Fibrobacter sp.]|uniref:hypothetical protein n=1 Tax=Fibrobacter sp. TaxID=35828 RepID=UPI00262B00E2|nr:hypothetical protein [Fibrobacter sp.]